MPTSKYCTRTVKIKAMRSGNSLELQYNFGKMYRENRYIITGTFRYIITGTFRYIFGIGIGSKKLACFGSLKIYQKILPNMKDGRQNTTRPVQDRFHDSSKSVLVISSWFAQICLRYHQLNTSWERMAKTTKSLESVLKNEKVW